MSIWDRLFGRSPARPREASRSLESASGARDVESSASRTTGAPARPAGDRPSTDASLRPPAFSGPEQAPPSSRGLHGDDRHIRVFLSSTFRDMQQERHLLVTQVFPELRRICAERFVTFTEVDLRWGITGEQAAEGRVLPICLEEIQRTRPYFIGILGERYGWIPQSVPSEVLARESWLEEHMGRRTSVTELEILHGVLNDPAMASHAFFYFRDPRYVAALPEPRRRDFASEDAASAEKLEHLKSRIRKSGLPVAENYASPEALADIVRRQFLALIDRLYPLDQAPDALVQEALAHDSFASRKLLAHVARPAHTDALDAFASATTPGKGLVVSGDSGGGKTVLLADWVRRWRQSHPTGFVFAHYFGSTPDSASVPRFLTRLLGELKRRYEIADDLPSSPEKLRDTLPLWLARSAARGRIVLVLDALNQIEGDEPDRRLRWLPPHLPPNVHVIASALPGPALDALRERAWAVHSLPPPDAAERGAMIDAFFAHYRKNPGRKLREQIASAPGSANPLYLRTVLEELRQSGNFEQLPAAVAEYLAVTAPDALFRLVLGRWRRDFDAGCDLTSRALRHLWAARQGLNETEWLALLGTTAGPLQRQTWAPLFFAVEPHLAQRSGLFAFGHDFLRQAVEAEFLGSEDQRRTAHLALADYFHAQSGASTRRAVELPWQWLQARAWPELTRLLEDMTFVNAAWDRGYFDLEMYWAAVERHTGVSPYQAYRRWVEAPGDLAASDWQLLRLLRDFATTREHVKTLLALCERLLHRERNQGNTNLLRRLLAEKVVLLWGAGDYATGIKVCRELESFARRAEDHHRLQIALDAQANILERTGHEEAALAKAKEAEEICRAHQNLAGLQGVLGNHATVLVKLQRFEEALVLLREAEKISRDLGHIDGLVGCLPKKVLATAALTPPEDWDIDALEKPLIETEELARRFGKKGVLTYALEMHRKIVHAHALAHCARERWEAALNLLRRLEPVYSELKDLRGPTREDRECLENLVRCMINCAAFRCQKCDRGRLALMLAEEALQSALHHSMPELARTCASVVNTVRQWTDYHEAQARWETLPPADRAVTPKPAEPEARFTLPQSNAGASA